MLIINFLKLSLKKSAKQIFEISATRAQSLWHASLNICHAFKNGIVSLSSSSNTVIHTFIKSIVNSFSNHLTFPISFNFL